MLGRDIAWSIVALGVASAMWACGSDGDDSTAATGGASAGAGGHAAGATGNTAGGGGTTAQAGSAGAGGTGAGGGSAGKGGTDPGGDAAAGMGGAGPIDLGGAGGEVAQGGEGGASAPTLADNCATVCGDQTSLSCTYGTSCVSGCTGIADPGATAFPDEYAAMIACQATQLTAAQYECSTQSTSLVQPSPKASTACETLICKWTCDDGTFGDENAFARCGC